MKRTVVKIDENICNGCGSCVEGCHEGALQIIDGKARIINEIFCDGLGACIGECPVGAIQYEEKETEPYDEYAVMERLALKGEKTIQAHLLHLKNHNEMAYFEQGLHYLKEHNIHIDMSNIENCGTCPGSAEKTFKPSGYKEGSSAETGSLLSQWPVQLH
ncbi:MAG: 4Fe-4S ferredoxin, partial [Spirochaetaceae bacterium]|nr:4Fe-4S ferredoxin [Spirochaetaceae bacterium]